MNERWTAVDHYLTDLYVAHDPVLEAALQTSAEAGLPPINVAPNQGKWLHLLAMTQGAHRILEIGTLGGYSTIWLARALPKGGHLITLEYEAKHADVARKNIARAGLSAVVDVRLGPANQTLAKMVAEKYEPFDFIFIDADKQGYTEYLAWSLKLSRKGTCILADNVVRDGAVIDPGHADDRVRGIRRFHEALAAEKRVSATAIQTVGSKGYDGFTMAVVMVDP